MGTTDKIRTIYTTMTGSVIYGRGIGKHVGTPTADLRVKDQTKLPEIGVYTSKIILCHYIFYGVTHIGTRPTLDTDKRISVETHILKYLLTNSVKAYGFIFPNNPFLHFSLHS